jgi:hypothetical protein
MEEEQNHVAEALLALADFACEEETKAEKFVDRVYHDGIVPGRDESSEVGLSWSSRGRDVPTMHHHDVIKEEPAIPQSRLPSAPPLVTDQSQESMMASMVEYFSMMQRLMMQTPENQHILMQMMSGQQPSAQHSQMLQKMQQVQQMQQMQMLMAMQANPSLMNSLAAGHQEQIQTPFFNNGMMHGDNGHSYPDLFMGRTDS